ncbi:MAG: hypothetical protein AB7I13_17450 [Vicinamibacterales bacterium]
MERDDAEGRVGAEPAAGSAAAAASGSSMTLTGCLQMADSAYVLTQVNEPGHTAGDGGAAEAQKDQALAARHSYRLEGGSLEGGSDEDRFKPMIGTRVQVIGRLAEPSSLAGGATGQTEVGTQGARTAEGGAQADRRPTDSPIEVEDLAQVDVESISTIADTCGVSPGQ